mmetsp:Transcript_93558/g.273996  ORF Transcript_93558/g.273996 Transcript_93558/m.273996 type:complete len:98 (-) Transcript_93558:860-1153(-)
MVMPVSLPPQAKEGFEMLSDFQFRQCQAQCLSGTHWGRILPGWQHKLVCPHRLPDGIWCVVKLLVLDCHTVCVYHQSREHCLLALLASVREALGYFL